MDLSKTTRSESTNLALMCVIVLTFTYTVLANLPGLIADEGFHNPEIIGFFQGKIPEAWHITVPPVYHVTIASVLKIFGVYSYNLARLSHLLICLPLLSFLYLIAKELKFENKDYRVLLFLTCPIVLPFFSLLYTDIPATLVAVAAVLLTLKKRYWLAALVGALAIATRQPNLIWVAFCGVYAFFDLAGRQGFKSIINYRDKESWRALIKIVPFIGVCLIAAGIFYMRGSVAIGDAGSHPVGFNPSNLYMFLLVSFVIFLPYHLFYTFRAIRLLKEYPLIWLLIVAGLAIYSLTYSNSHPYNSQDTTFFLRNIILHHTLSRAWLKLLIFIPMVSAVFTYYFFLKDSKPESRLLLLMIYAFGLLTFVPLPMVEPRYYLTALALIIAVKPAVSARLDLACIAANVPISCLFLYLISKYLMFI